MPSTLDGKGGREEGRAGACLVSPMTELSHEPGVGP